MKIKQIIEKLQDKVCSHIHMEVSFETELVGFDMTADEFVYDIYEVTRCTRCGRKWRERVRCDIGERNADRTIEFILRQTKKGGKA